jgi:transcriptional regulator with XRE-family HTH domain
MKNSRYPNNDKYVAVFPTRLREVMDSSKTTQAELAKQTGVSRQAISKYMDGSNSPNAETLFKICSYFKMPSDYFIGLTNSKSVDFNLQFIQDKIGYSIEAINNLETLYHANLFSPRHPTQNVSPFDYMLINQRFFVDYPNKLRAYFIARDNDSEQNDSDIARYTLVRVFERFIDDFYNHWLKFISDNKPRIKPGRKRKESQDEVNAKSES